MNALPNIRGVECNADQGETDSGYGEGEPGDPFSALYGMPIHWYFTFMALLALPLYGWSFRWWKSGTPLLMFTLLYGRVQWFATSPTLLAVALLGINVAYALCTTSWLFYKFYLIACYPVVCVLALFSDKRLQRQVRRFLRVVLKNFHFYEDKLAFFDIPAIDIDDGDVPCLLVIRGCTFTVSTMTLEVHGVEVGVKLNEDVEIAIQTDSFTWRIMRDIRIGDIYASLKGPFTPKAKCIPQRHQSHTQAAKDLTHGEHLKSTETLTGINPVSEYDQAATNVYTTLLNHIKETNTTYQARNTIDPEITDENRIRAAIGSTIFADRSVPNPPNERIKSSYLNSLIPGWLKLVFQKMPVLIRLFLNPVSYNHPVYFKSIVMTGSGKYLNQILDTQFFKYYPEENKEIRKLHEEVGAFLLDGKFSVILPSILGLASVPFMTQYDIMTLVKASKVLVHKSTQDEDGSNVLAVTEIAEVTGLSASFTIPSYLLPNHEHLLPDPPEDIHAPDEADVLMSILASLPAKFDPAMIEFASALLKASQVLTLHKQATSMSEPVTSPVHFGKLLGRATKEQVKKELVEAHVDDTWLHKLIIKAFHALQAAKGDAGYQMNLQVDLKDLRPAKYVRRTSITTTTTDPESRRSSCMSHTSTGSFAHA